MIRPSSLPFLSACPCWTADQNRGEQDKHDGTLRHSALAHALAGDETELNALADDDQDRVRWAMDYIKTKSPDGELMHIEEVIEVLDDDFELITRGTPDATCGNQLFDLKWRERNYREQMAAYALGMIRRDGWDHVQVHVLPAWTMNAEVFTLTESEAAEIVGNVIKSVNNPEAKPVACGYCGWCSKRVTCPAKTNPTKQIVDHREEFTSVEREQFAAWLADGAHSSRLSDALTAGLVLKIARQIADWCEAVEHHCKELAVKQGIIPTGYKLQSRQGNRFISSVTDAFARAGLPQEEFLPLCEIKLTALVEKFATVNGMKKAQAERTVEEKLGEIIQRKASSLSLVADKGEK